MYNINDWKPSDDQSYHREVYCHNTGWIKENILSSSTLIILYFRTKFQRFSLGRFVSFTVRVNLVITVTLLILL